MGIMGKSEQATHYTQHGTRKYQANGPVGWAAVFRRVAGKDGREGEGIRAALAYAAGHEAAFASWAESHISAWAPATSAPIGKGAGKAPKAPKATKAPKAHKAASKGAKGGKGAKMAVPVAKPEKGKPAKVGKGGKVEQLEMTGTTAPAAGA